MSLSVDVSVRPEEKENFAGSLNVVPLGSVLLVASRYTAHTMVRSKRTIARTGGTHVILDVFTGGGFTGTVGGRRFAVGLGDGFAIDLAGTFRIHLAAGSYVGVVMPRDLFETSTGGARARHGLRLAAAHPEVAVLYRLLENLLDQAPRLSALRASALGLALVGMVGACLASEHPATGDEASEPAEPSLVQLRRYVERHASDPGLSPARLAQALGLSRSTLYRLCQPEGGAAEMIRRRRANIACRLLGEGSSAVPAVARASGFSDERSLRRALREYFDKSPKQLRLAQTLVATYEHSIAIGAMFDS